MNPLFPTHTILYDNKGKKTFVSINLEKNAYIGYCLNIPFYWWDDNNKIFKDPHTDLKWFFKF